MYKRVDYQRLRITAEQQAMNVFGAEAVYGFEPHFNDPALPLVALQRQQFPYVLMILAAARDFADLLDKVHDYLGGEAESAEKMVLTAVNHAPEVWKNEQQEFLRERGIVRGLEAFYKGRKEELAYRPDFDRFLAILPEESKKIALAAVDASHLHKNKYGVTMKDRALLFIPIQLLPDINKRGVVFVTMKRDHGTANYNIAVDSSANAVKKIATALGISMEALPSAMLSLKAARTPLTSRTILSPSDDMAYAAEDMPSVKINLPHNSEALGEALQEMILFGDITERQKDIYLYAITPRHDGNLPTEGHIVSSFIRRVGPRGQHETYLSRKELRELMPRITQQLEKSYDQPPVNPLVLKP